MGPQLSWQSTCMACRGSAVQIRMAPLNFFSHTNSFQTAFSNNITFVPTCPSLFMRFCSLKCSQKYFFVAEMKSPKWVAMTRQLIKSNHGFGWSISGWERNNKLITKVVYRYPDGSRNSILVDLIWTQKLFIYFLLLIISLIILI